MSGPKFLDALASERRHNAFLRWTLVGVIAVSAFGYWQSRQVPKSIDVHLAPDMKAGDTVRVVDGESPIPPVNVYGFAYYIWQQLNRWQADGAKDYGQQIYNFQSYLTPACQAQLTADMENRFKAGELLARTRTVSEIPGFPYASNRVVPDGNGVWTVLLDMQVMESYRGQPVKDAFIRYPLRIVRYDVDRERNPWRLALDCYGTKRPARLDEKELRESRAKKLPPKVPDMPDAIEPSALPHAVPLGAADEAAAPSLAPAGAARPQASGATPTGGAVQPQP